MSKKINVVPQLLSLYTLQGSAPGLADTVTMGTVWHRLCPAHPLLPSGSCLITCESSHARRGKALMPIYPGPLWPLTWPLRAFSQVTTVSLNRLEDLGWYFKYFLFTAPLEKDLAISKKPVCIYPLNQQSHFEDSTPRRGSSSVADRITVPQRRPRPHPHKLWPRALTWQKGLYRCD